MAVSGETLPLREALEGNQGDRSSVRGVKNGVGRGRACFPHREPSIVPPSGTNLWLAEEIAE